MVCLGLGLGFVKDTDMHGHEPFFYGKSLHNILKPEPFVQILSQKNRKFFIYLTGDHLK